MKNWEKIWTSWDDILFPVLKSYPKNTQGQIGNNRTTSIVITNHHRPKNLGLKTIGDTILMQVEPWFSHEVGKDFRKRENGGGDDYHCMGKGVKILVCSKLHVRWIRANIS